MNMIYRYTLRSLMKNKTRTIVTLVGIVLAIAMITSVTTLMATLQNFMVERAIVSYGDWHGVALNVPEDILVNISQDPRIEKYRLIQNIGYASLEGSKNQYKPYVFLVGFYEDTYDCLNIKLIQGRFPKNANEVIIPEHISYNGGVTMNIGDQLDLSIGYRYIEEQMLWQFNSYEEPPNLESLVKLNDLSFTIVGIMERPSFEEFSAPGYTVITKLSSEEVLLTQDMKNFDVYIKAKQPMEIFNILDTHASMYGHMTNQPLLMYQGSNSNEVYLSVVYGLATILIVLIISGAVLLIYNSFMISLSERAKEFGLLSSVGATKKQLKTIVMLEAITLSSIGIPVGIASGILGMYITLELIGDAFITLTSERLPMHFYMSNRSIIMAAIMGWMTIYLSALIPAKRIYLTPTMNRIQQNQDMKLTKRKVRTHAMVKKVFGFEGEIALKNYKRSQKRYRSTVISLLISVVLFVSASSFGHYIKLSSEQVVQNLDFDLSFHHNGMTVEEAEILLNELNHTPEIQEGTFYQALFMQAIVEREWLNERYVKESNLEEYKGKIGVWVLVVRDEEWLNFISSHEGNTKGVYSDQIAYYDFESRRYVTYTVLDKALSEITVEWFHELEVKDKNTRFQIDVSNHDQWPMGVVAYQQGGLMVMIPQTYAQSLWEMDEIAFSHSRFFFSSSQPTISYEDMKERLIQQGYSSRNLYNASDQLENNKSLLLLINVFSYGFIILISLIAIANVFNTISTNVLLRRQELLMLKAIGMTTKNLKKMMHYECLFYGFKALFYGLPVSLLMSWLIYESIAYRLEIPFSWPIRSMIISIVSIFVVVFVTMMYSRTKVSHSEDYFQYRS